ncbi:hypothetical protein AUJ77_01090 [Candidatus Nomurabacteria bacterium CG1_02_43_90]|uniref:Phosphoribosylanthranilate isomerase n=1 Tax=Candidatus Nomurabacteria bacterium CG1_02_43_90 TaxID=1805281 RepID=A0A1J4V172_9BACT|nr:MAG: hypothetical protein AUJ77_01090 [Candidatus Nomurabacteria bacterium CG1_02_43_90]
MLSYVGVTGFGSRHQVKSVLRSVPFGTNRKLMVGVRASHNTIDGGKHLFPCQYPSGSQMRTIFVNDPRVLNLVHFNTRDPDLLYEQLMDMWGFAGTLCHGFQLNMIWPSPEVIRKVKARWKECIIVLWVCTHAFEVVENNPKTLADKVEREYKGLIDYILLDASGGFGKPLDTEVLRGYLRAITAKNLPIGLGVAGGLSPSTLGLVEPLIKEFPRLSIDAEGCLMDEGDHLNLTLAHDFVNNSLLLFGEI